MEATTRSSVSWRGAGSNFRVLSDCGRNTSENVLSHRAGLIDKHNDYPRYDCYIANNRGQYCFRLMHFGERLLLIQQTAGNVATIVSIIQAWGYIRPQIEPFFFGLANLRASVSSLLFTWKRAAITHFGTNATLASCSRRRLPGQPERKRGRRRWRS